jgi:2-desacetyl-2-hydroxyethyl bacteriochlorophyllide A dehydrogenase
MRSWEKSSMKPRRIVAVAKSTITLDVFELPAVGPDQVLVETRYSAISPGTELAFLHKKPNTPGKYPYYPGYSASGRIVEKGQAVESTAIGQRVACPIPHASHFVVEARKCLPLPEWIDGPVAATYRLASIALQGVRKAQIQLGWEVAVLGLGPIGNLAGQLSRAAGATYVEGIDPIPWRRELALQCGFDAVTDSSERTSRRPELDAGVGFDAVIEATGVPDAVPTAFWLAKRLGHVILLGSTRGNTQKVNFYRDVHKKGLTVIGAHDLIRPSVDDHLFYVSQRKDEETVLKLLGSGRIQTASLISDVVSPEEAAHAYDRLTKQEEELMLIAFKWR